MDRAELNNPSPRSYREFTELLEELILFGILHW
jgi:hypothetical protein